MTTPGAFSSLTGDDAPSILRNDDDGIAWLTIHRPHVANALSADAIRRLCDELVTLDDNPAIRAIVIRGAGERAFSAGIDLGDPEIRGMRPMRGLARNVHELILELR